MRALIVDDSTANRDLLRALLEGCGYEVDEACQGAEALAKAREHPPDVVIADLLTRVMDGYTLLREWKGDARLQRIPFVVYTATSTTPEDEKRERDLGVDAFIASPVEPEAFVALLRAGAWIGDRVVEERPANAPRGHGERILYVDDEEALVFLVVRVMNRLGYRVTGHTRPLDAIASFRADPQGFDLVICDLNMPGMSGMEVAKQVMLARPEVPVALVSGYVLPADVERARALGIREIVLKPNTVEELGPVAHRLMTDSDGRRRPSRRSSGG